MTRDQYHDILELAETIANANFLAGKFDDDDERERSKEAERDLKILLDTLVTT